MSGARRRAFVDGARPLVSTHSISSVPTRDAAIPSDVVPDMSADPSVYRSLASGTQLGRYVVLYRLAGGGMGVVYAAYDPQLDRKVALKVMKPRRKATSRERARQRLIQEAQTLAKLAHPNVVAIHDVGSVGEIVYVAMDFVEGRTLREWLRQKRRSVDEVVDVFLQAGRGLAAAHEAGIVHRDFKPDNVLIERDLPGKEASKGRVQVVDFGLALVRDSDTDPSSDASSGPSRPTGLVGRVGTPGYMAPEQHLAVEVTPAADQFAFCVCLYEALWRRCPFAGADTDERAMQAVQGKIRDVPRNIKVPGHLRRLVLRGLQREPADRFGSMKTLLTELRKRPWRRRKRLLSTGALAVGVAAATWAWAGDSTRDPPACAAATSRLAPAWSEDTRSAVYTGLAATHRPHAAHTAKVVTDTLQRYATLWAATYTETCQATHVHHEQSVDALELSMSCLTRARNDLAALTELFSEADEDVADHALSAAQALPSVDECRDAVRLRDRSALPDDLGARERIEEQFERLANARALEHAGRVADAVSVSGRVVQRARDLEHPPLTAEALLQHAIALEAASRIEDAAEHLREAVVEAEKARDDRLLAAVRLQLASVVGDRLARPDEGKLWASLTRAAISRLDGDLGLEAQLENILGFVIGKEAAPEEVLEHHRRAVALAEQGGVPDTRKAMYYGNLAASLSDVGHHDEALRMAKNAKSLAKSSFGAQHYRTAVLDATFGVIYEAKGDFEAALEHYGLAVKNLDQALGKGSLHSASVLNNIGTTAAKMGDFARAARAFERSLALQRAAHGEGHADVAQAYSNLGSLMGMADKHEQALAHHEKALALRQDLLGPDSLQTADSMAGIANQLEQLQRPRESLVYRRKALAVQERVYGPRHFEMLVPYANYAHTLIDVGQMKEALDNAERALQLALDHDVAPDLQAFARLVLAKALSHAGGDTERIKTLVEQAREQLGDMNAPAERKLLVHLEARHRFLRDPASGRATEGSSEPSGP